MQWSQLKKHIEETFAESVRDRVEVWATRYRHAHDQEGEVWITFDKTRIISLGTWSYEEAAEKARIGIREASGCLDYRIPEQRSGYNAAHAEAEAIVHWQGYYPLWDAYKAMYKYLSLSIDDILVSGNPLIQSLGMLDRRFGKRRLLGFVPDTGNQLLATLYACRRTCDGKGIPDASPASR